MGFEGYQEALESQKEKEDRVSELEDQMHSLISALTNLKEQGKINTVVQILFNSGILRGWY